MEDAEDDQVAQPHDAFFKEVFSDLERASGFFQEHLPESLVAQVDWPSLELIPASFVRQNLEQSHSDLLYSVRAAGREIQLYLLFEHQSTVAEEMPLRLLGYQ